MARSLYRELGKASKQPVPFYIWRKALSRSALFVSFGFRWSLDFYVDIQT